MLSFKEGSYKQNSRLNLRDMIGENFLMFHANQLVRNNLMLAFNTDLESMFTNSYKYLNPRPIILLLLKTRQLTSFWQHLPRVSSLP